MLHRQPNYYIVLFLLAGLSPYPIPAYPADEGLPIKRLGDLPNQQGATVSVPDISVPNTPMTPTAIADNPSSPFEKSNTITLYSGYKQGETLYQIGGLISNNIGSFYERFPTSELRFPLTTPTLGLDFHRQINQKFFVSIGMETNLNDQPGVVKDSDWGLEPFYSDVLNIYSESKASAFFIEGHARLLMRPKMPGSLQNTRAGLGIDLLYYTYDIRDLDQTSNYSKAPTGKIPGIVGFYRITYVIPHVIVQYIAKPRLDERLAWNASFKLTPLAFGFDRDEHILRRLSLTGNTHGFSASAEIEGDFRINNGVKLYAVTSYSVLETSGTQRGEYAVPTASGITNDTAQLLHRMRQFNLRAGVSVEF